jgi:site-specific recombinase XerD
MSNTLQIQANNADGAKPAVAYLLSLRTETGRRGMVSALNGVARILGLSDWRAVDWTTLNAANVRAVMARIEGAPATRNKCLSALKGVARMAAELGLLTGEAVSAIERIRGDKGSRLPKGRHIGAGEVVSLIQTCAADLSAAGARDTAIIALMRATGLRRAEVASLKLADLDADRAMVRIIGKGNKERNAYIRNGAQRAMLDWLAVRGTEGAYIFCPINKGGRLDTSRGMTTTAVHNMLMKRATEAGVNDLTAHDFRRTFVSDLLDAGADISTVANLAGHSSVTTTQRYDRRGERAAEQATSLISVPYFKRKD